MKALVIVAFALLPAWASAQRWESVPPSRLGFTGSAQGERFDGEFARFRAVIDFDPARPEAARFEVVIDLASADSRNAERDELLREAAFFALDTHPEARYEANGAEADGEGWITRGQLTLKGRRHEVPLRFRFTPVSTTEAELEGEATLDRTWFAIGSGEWEDPELIAHEVEVHTRLRLRPAQDATTP